MDSILFVCTGNICRSPMAEGFLRRELEERLGRGAPEVSSTGTWGFDASPATPESVDAAAEFGVDITSHVARPIQRSFLEDATAVICMTAEQSAEVVALDPGIASKTYTLKELVRLLAATPAASQDVPLEGRIAEVDQRRRIGFAGQPWDEDVVDPYGASPTTYRAVAWEIHELCSQLATRLFGPDPRGLPAGNGP